jgi:uncharacterized protein with NRDE domain
MCLVFLWRAPVDEACDAWERELAKRYRLVIASNRDEILSRPADRLGRWRDNEKVVGGRDVQGGGTWLGMSDGGRWSCILNVREPESAPENAPSRGALCADFLLGESTPEDAARAAVRDGARYAGFNVVFGANNDAWHACNRSGAVPMPRGVSAITNAAPGLDAAWPTAQRGRARFAEALRDAADDALVEALFEVLADGTKLPLSPTRMPRDVEDRLCYICVPPVEVSLNKFWGTRTHTVVLVRADGSVTAVERSRLPGESDVREEFSLT